MKIIKNTVFVLLLIANSLLLSTCGVFHDILTNVSSKEPNEDIGIRIKSINFSGNWYFNHELGENQLEISSFWMDDFPLYFDVVYTPDKIYPYSVFYARVSNLDNSRMYYYTRSFELSTNDFDSIFREAGGHNSSDVINSTPKTVFKKGTNNDLIFNYENDLSFIDVIGEIIIDGGKPMFYLVNK